MGVSVCREDPGMTMSSVPGPPRGRCYNKNNIGNIIKERVYCTDIYFDKQYVDNDEPRKPFQPLRLDICAL